MDGPSYTGVMPFTHEERQELARGGLVILSDGTGEKPLEFLIIARDYKHERVGSHDIDDLARFVKPKLGSSPVWDKLISIMALAKLVGHGCVAGAHGPWVDDGVEPGSGRRWSHCATCGKEQWT